MLTAEHWAIYPEDSRYSASDLGRIKNNTTGKIVNGRIIRSKSLPYIRFKLGKQGKTVGVHYVVLSSFIPKPEGDWMCDHINHNTLDNRLENLRWVSCRANNMNSDYRTIYGFLDGEYIGTFVGWQGVSEFTGMQADYLQKRSNGDKRYATRSINGYTFITKKKFHQRFIYIW